MTDDIKVTDAADESRYEIRQHGDLVGFAEYTLPDDVHVDFTHTEIDDAYEGQGMAGRLAAAALDDVRARGKRVIPHCPYIAKFIKRHPEYDDITDWPVR